MLVLACEFDNVTPYRVETIDKKRLKRGLMNREEEDDSVTPIGEVVGWIEANLWTNYGWCRCHVLLPWIDYHYHYCNTLLVYRLINGCTGMGGSWGLQ